MNKSFKPLGTLIHGIAASEHLDSSGERLVIEGLDISSLDIDGLVTYEHKNDQPSQIVGKILKAKKIFSKEDCETKEELYFWEKSQAPYVYIIGELFDGVGHEGAKQVASMFKYDTAARSAGRESKNVMNFSIEGSKLGKDGQKIESSLARKVTVTGLPCNKMAIAEELVTPQDTEESIEKSEQPYGQPMGKAAPKLGQPIIAPAIAQTSTKTSKKKPLPWWAESPKDVESFKEQKQNLRVADRRKNMNPKMAPPGTKVSETPKPSSLKPTKVFSPDLSGKVDYKKVTKTLTADSAMGSPSTYTQGAALASSSIEKDLKKLPEFKTFLKSIETKYPGLKKDESEAMAKYFTARLMIKAEEALEKMASIQKSDDLDKSKNVREQKAKLFGTDANAPRLSDKRMKMMQYIRDFSEKKFGTPFVTAEGKRDSEGKMREDKENQPPFDVFSEKGIQKEKALLDKYKKKGIKRVDPKPDWRSGRLETQPSPDAAIHETAHLYLAPEGMTPAIFQEHMDKLWGESQSKHGHMQQKRTAGEIQPMSVENPIRREMGLPANKTTKPVKRQERALDYEGDRFVEGKDSKGRKAFYDRQSRLMTPETKERVQQVREGSLKFSPEKGWHKDSSPDSLINLRGRGMKEEAKTRAEERYAKPAVPQKMAASELSKGSMYKRCWDGYKPTPGKKSYEKGSCQPISKSSDTMAQKRQFAIVPQGWRDRRLDQATGKFVNPVTDQGKTHLTHVDDINSLNGTPHLPFWQVLDQPKVVEGHETYEIHPTGKLSLVGKKYDTSD